jgi:hypothetical protein
MSAGTAFAKRYAGGYVDLPTQTTPIDSTALNALETALLQLISAAATVDGQVAQWDFANTRFGPALLLNKNIDPSAAIASSKIDFTGGNGIVDANIAAAAAIARTKLNFGSGLVNADIAAAAAIAISKLAGYPADGTKVLKGDGTWATALTTNVWQFSGKNNGSNTDITMTTKTYDDIGSDDWTAHAYYTVPATGKYIVFVQMQQISGTGTGGMGGTIIHKDSTGSSIATLATMNTTQLNTSATIVAGASYTASDRIVVQESNGASGSAGTCQGVVTVMRVA